MHICAFSTAQKLVPLTPTCSRPTVFHLHFERHKSGKSLFTFAFPLCARSGQHVGGLVYIYGLQRVGCKPYSKRKDTITNFQCLSHMIEFSSSKYLSTKNTFKQHKDYKIASLLEISHQKSERKNI